MTLTPDERKVIREKSFPSSESVNIEEHEEHGECVDDVQVATEQALLSKLAGQMDEELVKDIAKYITIDDDYCEFCEEKDCSLPIKDAPCQINTARGIFSQISAIHNAQKQEAVKKALKAIADEDEFPSDMPDELCNELNGNRPNTEKAMRNTVRLTKENITKRFIESLKGGTQ